MASKEAPKADAAAADAVPAPRRSKKLLILILIVVLLLGLIGGGAIFLLKKNAAQPDNEAAMEESNHSSHEWPEFDPSKPPVFMALDAFTVNLQPDNGEQFLQVVASVRVIDAHVGDIVKSYMPQIRHEILSLLSGKKASEIITPEGREDLALEMKDIMNEVLGWEPPPAKKDPKGHDEAVGPIVSVYFTQFIVQ